MIIIVAQSSYEVRVFLFIEGHVKIEARNDRL